MFFLPHGEGKNLLRLKGYLFLFQPELLFCWHKKVLPVLSGMSLLLEQDA